MLAFVAVFGVGGRPHTADDDFKTIMGYCRIMMRLLPELTSSCDDFRYSLLQPACHVPACARMTQPCAGTTSHTCPLSQPCGLAQLAWTRSSISVATAQYVHTSANSQARCSLARVAMYAQANAPPCRRAADNAPLASWTHQWLPAARFCCKAGSTAVTLLQCSVSHSREGWRQRRRSVASITPCGAHLPAHYDRWARYNLAILYQSI